jgi:hypothetical protein
MHLNFAFTFNQILWTVTFAAQLVLLIVLLGRERSQRFPFFTASILVMALRLLFEELLSGRMPVFTLQSVLLSLEDLSAILGLLVVVEIARLSFPGARRSAWLIAAPLLVLLAGLSLVYWGPWPPHAELAVDSRLALLRLMQFLGQKADIYVGLLTVGLSLLVLCFGRRFKTGWRKHSSLLLVGLFVSAATWLGISAYWQHVMHSIHPGITREQYQQVVALSKTLFSANRIVGIAVTLGWIASMWIDEPVSNPVVETAAQELSDLPAAADAAPAEE